MHFCQLCRWMSVAGQRWQEMVGARRVDDQRTERSLLQALANAEECDRFPMAGTGPPPTAPVATVPPSTPAARTASTSAAPLPSTSAGTPAAVPFVPTAADWQAVADHNEE